MSDQTRSTAAEIAAALADGSTTSVEVTQQHLAPAAALAVQQHPRAQRARHHSSRRRRACSTRAASWSSAG